ncbi:MAG: hypothetical protein ACXWUN_08415 [Allosphingosinicella sp.]
MRSPTRGPPCRLVALLVMVLLWAMPAAAEVRISFHSKELGVTFPHAFILLGGTLDETGEAVEASYGFTVRHVIGPSILFGPVHGDVVSETPGSVHDSNHHFTMVLTDAQYRTVMEVVERWRALPQPSYALNRRTCVSFVAEVAAALGLAADASGLLRKPGTFLERVRAGNEAAIAAAAPPAATTAAATR